MAFPGTGQWLTQIPQRMHFFLSMTGRLVKDVIIWEYLPRTECIDPPWRSTSKSGLPYRFTSSSMEISLPGAGADPPSSDAGAELPSSGTRTEISSAKQVPIPMEAPWVLVGTIFGSRCTR